MKEALIITTSMTSAFVVVMILKIARKRSGIPQDRQFDERQILARNNAYMTGFFVTLLLMLADILLKLAGKEFYTDPLAELSAVFIGIGVFAVLAVWNDAFLLPAQKPFLQILLYGVIAAERMLRFLYSLRNGECFSFGKLTLSCINGVIAVTFLSIFVILLLKQHNDRSED